MLLRFFVLLTLIIAPLCTNAQNAPAKSRGNSFNPDISLNTLLTYENSNRGNSPTSDPQNGFGLQESEIQFSADVDPYSRVQAIFSLHPELDTSSVPYQTDYVFEPEEVFAETTSLPNVTLKAGKFKTAFGRHNQLHTHAYPFIDAPLIQSQLLGEDGFNDQGLSASTLLPMAWFSEFTAQALSGRSEGLDQFKNSSPNAVVGLAHFKNLWDLSETSTLQVGLSFASGKNSFQSSTEIYGLDATIKWRPLLFGNTRAIVWSTELISRDLKRPGSSEKSQGVTSHVQYQASARWWLQARGEYLQIKDDSLTTAKRDFSRKQSALVAFVPTEFSSLRLQYDHLSDNQTQNEHKITLQMNFSIGAHPAHLY
ncbi:MAG: hypothetical protein AB7N80_13270 [Bdellovibrionales bacterium]